MQRSALRTPTHFPASRPGQSGGFLSHLLRTMLKTEQGLEIKQLLPNCEDSCPNTPKLVTGKGL